MTLKESILQNNELLVRYFRYISENPNSNVEEWFEKDEDFIRGVIDTEIMKKALK